MLNRFFKQILIVATVGGVLFSCGNEKKPENDTPINTVMVGADVDFDGMLQKIPKATQVPALLERSGADFMPSLINDVKKSEKYMADDEKAALNLGIYGADLAYLATYDKQAATFDYFKVSKKLADKLGVADGFDSGLIQKFEVSLNNKDSLLSLIEKSSTKVRDFLNTSRRHALQGQVLTGSFIEGLYLSTQMIKSVAPELPDDQRNVLMIELTRTVLEQKATMQRLMEFLSKASATEPSLDELIAKLSPLEKEFEKFDVEEAIKNNDGSLVLKSESLQGITTITAGLRKEIVD
jgi:hypothetical protein